MTLRELECMHACMRACFDSVDATGSQLTHPLRRNDLQKAISSRLEVLAHLLEHSSLK